MPESSFTSANQIVSTEIDQDSPVTEGLMTKYKNRDIELIDAMAKLGGPSSVGSGSAIAYEGDVTISANTTLEGLHYYNNLTINTGITVTVTRNLIIVAKGIVTIAGTINAQGQGSPGGAAGISGTNGTAGLGGGGGANNANPGFAGGSCVIDETSQGGGSGGTTGSQNGTAGAALAAYIKGLSIHRRAMTGGGGGGGAVVVGAGGSGGGGVCIIAPSVNLTSGTINANGAAGSNGPGTGEGGGGGGGGGNIYIGTKTYTAGTLTVSGGSGGTGAGGGNGGNGGAGGSGVLQIDIFA